MGKWIVLLLMLFSFSLTVANEELPRPLPDESYPGEPYPVPPPSDPPKPPPPKPSPPKKEIPYTLGSGETARMGSRTFEFYPRVDLNRVVRIRLVGVRNNLEIDEVTIQYSDYYGGERNDLRLPGELKSGGTRESVLDGRPVYRIRIKASASYFWKKPGGFRVDVISVR